MTEIIRFEMNVPAEVALKHAGPGKSIEGRYGNRVMYTLADNRVMYVAPIVASRISNLGIQAGEVFQVCKQEKTQGRKKLIEWQVQRLESEPETKLEHELRESIEVAQAAKATQVPEAGKETALQKPPVMAEQAAPPDAPPPPAVVAASNGSSNGTGASAARNGNSSPAPTTKLEHALKTAISAANNAEKYGAELGYVVRFDADAIKSMAITVLINMSEGKPQVIENAHAGEGTPPIPSPIASSEALTQSAAVLSPSQVRCFMDCQMRWWFKYGLKIPDLTTANMVLGRAVHSSLGENFAQKVDTREDLPIEGVLALFREAWTNEIEQTEFRDEENPKELAATGEALVTKYMDQMAPAIDPAAVEIHVNGEIGGVKVRGWIDLLDVEGRVIDIKTAKAKPSAIEPMHKFQVATYAHLLPGASGVGRIDTLVKTKSPQIISQSFQITEEELRVPQTLYPAAQEAMRLQRYIPNRLSMMCSRRNCSYWRHCEREWGGEVPEA